MVMTGTTILTTLPLLLELATVGVRSEEGNTCSEGVVASYQLSHGQLSSPPSLLGSRPTHRTCQWNLVNPQQELIIISFNKFDLDQDHNCTSGKGDCCTHQWLMIKTEQDTQQEGEHIHSQENNHPKEKGDRENWRGLTNLENIDRMLASSHTHRGSGIAKRSEDNQPRHMSPLGFMPPSPPSFTPSREKEKARRKKEENSKSDSVFKTTGQVCGGKKPAPIHTLAKHVTVKFVSNEQADNTKQGFTLEYIKTHGGECGAKEVRCGEFDICIPERWLCNHQRECPDGSDEKGCPLSVSISEVCAGDMEEHCDGVWQCPHGEDEMGCYGCGANQWWCDRQESRDRVCFSSQQRCDGVANCLDGADERDCSDECAEFQCKKKCYTIKERCDGVADCADGSDEAACSPEICNNKYGRFMCKNGQCIREDRRCDQYNDCYDESDEEGCFRNTIVAVWAMGGVVCCLLLILALGCSGRVYALRSGLNNRSRHRSPACPAPLTRLQRSLQQREPPPSYTTALTDPAHILCGSGGDYLPRAPPLTRHGRPGLSGAEGSGSVGGVQPEKRGDVAAKVNTFRPLPPLPSLPSLPPLPPLPSQSDEDVPILPGLRQEAGVTDDVPFLFDSTDGQAVEDLVSMISGEENESEVRKGEEGSDSERWSEEERRGSEASSEARNSERNTALNSDSDEPEECESERTENSDKNPGKNEETKINCEEGASDDDEILTNSDEERQTASPMDTDAKQSAPSAVTQGTPDTPAPTHHHTPPASHPLVTIVNECSDDTGAPPDPYSASC